MDADFRAKIDRKLTDYRTWSQSHNLSGCRLVQYCGVDLVGALDIPADEIEAQIEGLLCEAFYVDWNENNRRLYLRVWEFDGPVPDWPKVFAEQPLANIDELLAGGAE